MQKYSIPVVAECNEYKPSMICTLLTVFAGTITGDCFHTNDSNFCAKTGR